ncbi:Short-chain dehydrogenase/reductase SDR [Apiospora arundinis]
MTADTLDLTGKVAIVTGSGRENGIDDGIAKFLARNGASVAIHYVSKSKIVKEYGVLIATVQGAVEEEGVAERIVSGTLAIFGATRIDILGR